MTKREYKRYPQLLETRAPKHGAKHGATTFEPIRRTDKVRKGEWR